MDLAFGLEPRNWIKGDGSISKLFSKEGQRMPG